MKNLGLGIAVLVAGIFVLLQSYARLQWKEANELRQIGFKLQALRKMQKGFFLLGGNGDYLYSLADLYESLGDSNSALFICEKASLTKSDYLLHRKMGKLYFEKSNFKKAEEHFLKAVYMVPNRFVSREMLIDFYIKTDNFSKAISWCKETLEMPIKVESPQVDHIRGRLTNYVKKQEW